MDAAPTRDLLQTKGIAADPNRGRLNDRSTTGHAKPLHRADSDVHRTKHEVGFVCHVVVATAAADIHVKWFLEEDPVAGCPWIARPAQIYQQVFVRKRLA